MMDILQKCFDAIAGRSAKRQGCSRAAVRVVVLPYLTLQDTVGLPHCVCTWTTGLCDESVRLLMLPLTSLLLLVAPSAPCVRML